MGSTGCFLLQRRLLPGSGPRIQYARQLAYRSWKGEVPTRREGQSPLGLCCFECRPQEPVVYCNTEWLVNMRGSEDGSGGHSPPCICRITFLKQQWSSCQSHEGLLMYKTTSETKKVPSKILGTTECILGETMEVSYLGKVRENLADAETNAQDGQSANLLQCRTAD